MKRDGLSLQPTGTNTALLVLPPGSERPAALPADTVVLRLSEDGYELLGDAGEARRLAPGAWVERPGWHLVAEDQRTDYVPVLGTEFTHPELRELDDEGRCKRTFHLALAEGEEAQLGRNDKVCDIVIHDERVSRRHLRVYRDGARFVAEDLQSTLGTTLNDLALREPRALSHGDRIAVGRATFEFHDWTQGLEPAAPESEAPPDQPRTRPTPTPDPVEDDVRAHRPGTPLWETALLIGASAALIAAVAYVLHDQLS